jgi:hypothetical protein
MARYICIELDPRSKLHCLLNEVLFSENRCTMQSWDSTQDHTREGLVRPVKVDQRQKQGQRSAQTNPAHLSPKSSLRKPAGNAAKQYPGTIQCMRGSALNSTVISTASGCQDVKHHAKVLTMSRDLKLNYVHQQIGPAGNDQGRVGNWHLKLRGQCMGYSAQ